MHAEARSFDRQALDGLGQRILWVHQGGVVGEESFVTIQRQHDVDGIAVVEGGFAGQASPAVLGASVDFVSGEHAPPIRHNAFQVSEDPESQFRVVLVTDCADMRQACQRT
ncbi:Uncharacterised protein [Mycobacteroides abscessus subsp. abscessus]|nr:Uncharacterised protein [Mycobacteroides abscessus subsp. abscessus]